MQSFWRVLPVLFWLGAEAGVRETFVTDSWTGTGETNGWQYADLGTPYRTDGQSVAIQFARRGARIESPQRTDTVVTVTLQLRSSPDPARPLLLTPLRDGVEAAAACALTPPNAERPTEQTVRFAKRLGVNGIRLEMGAGLSGNWGLYGVTFDCLAPNEVPVPYDLFQDGASHTLKARWRVSEDVVACQFRAIVTNAVPAFGRAVEDVNFSFVTNATRQSREITAQFPDALPSVSGQRLYAPPASTGIVMIGSSDWAGVLAYRPALTLGGRALHLRAWRFQSRDEGNTMPVNWTDGRATNALSVLCLGDEPNSHYISLAPVPDGATLLINSTTNRTTASGANGRVLIEALGIAEDIVAAHIETNELANCRCARTAVNITGLAPGASGLWSVRGYDDAGNVSDFAPHIPFTLDSAPRIGTWLHVK